MGADLRSLLNLPDLTASASSSQVDQFGSLFRARLDAVNQNMRLVAAHASPADIGALEGQRAKLIDAYQKASKEIAFAAPGGAAKSAERVIKAAGLIEGRTAEAANGANARRDAWVAREEEFDDAMVRIGELDAAGHPKAATLGKLGGAIRSRVSGRDFQTALTALDQLKPKLDAIYREHTQQAGDASPAAADDDLSDEHEDVKRFVTLWDDALGSVSAQVERLRQALAGDDSVRDLYDGLANVVRKFPDLDLRKLEAAAAAEDVDAYHKTLKQTAVEIKQTRDLLANGPLLSTIDENPFVKTEVHATVNRVLNEIVNELDIKAARPRAQSAAR